MAELYVPPSNQRRTIIVVTASNDRQAAAVEAELAARRQSGCFGPDVLLFAVPDPSSARVGSGGATFNALMTVQELVSSSLDIENCLVICIHSGGDSQRMYTQSVCGKAWSSLPSLAPGEAELDAPVDLLLRCMLRMFADVPSGLVVASSDVLLLIPESFYPAPGRPSHWAPTGATGLAIPTEAALGPNHGVYHVEGAGVGGGSVSRVKKFFQKASVPEMRAAGAVRGDDKVLIDTGVIYFSPPATSALLTLARTHPLDSCTYQGLDCGRPALRIELYSDIMMAMDGGLGLTFDEYCAVASSETKAKELGAAREVMWRHLRTAPFFAAVVEGGDFAHVGTTLEYLQLLTDPTPVQVNYGLATHAAWYSEGEAVAGVTGSVPPPPTRPAVCVQNSLFTTPGHISPGSVVEHSALSGEWRIGSGCLVSSVRTLPYLTVRDGIAVQEVSIPERGGRAVTVLACKDPIKDACNKPSARVCGVSWGTLWGALGLSEEAGRVAVWGDEAANPGACTLWNARLWAVTASSRGDSPIAATLNLGIDGVAAAGGGSKGGSPSPSSSVVPPGALTVDPVSADRIALWLQWLGVPTSGPEASAAAASLGLTLDQFLHTRAAHTQPSVTSQWLSAPRLCLRDILGAGDASLEFSWRRELRGNIDVALLVASIARDSQGCIAELVRRLGHGATPSATRTEGAAGTALHSSQHANSPGHTFARLALSRLDSIASTAPPNIAGRALSVQSALLWAMAGWGVHGHRSGPAYNAAWLPALALLDGDAHAGGRGGAQGGRGSPRGQAIAQLAVLREAWSHRAHLTGRAARHYERAAQLLTAQCVYTAPVAPPKMASTLPPMGHWTNAAAPVRIDLAGGWSDTPPLTYEAGSGAAAAAAAASELAAGGGAPTTVSQCATLGGGLVVNAGVLVDGVKSLGARVRRVPRTDASTPLILVRQRGPSPNAALADLARSQSDSGYSHGGSSPAVAAPGMAFSAIHAESGGAPGVVNSTESITALKDLGDYNQPHAASALVKCALLCLGFVKLPQQGGGGGSQ